MRTAFDAVFGGERDTELLPTIGILAQTVMNVNRGKLDTKSRSTTGGRIQQYHRVDTAAQANRTMFAGQRRQRLLDMMFGQAGRLRLQRR